MAARSLNRVSWRNVPYGTLAEVSPCCDTSEWTPMPVEGGQRFGRE